MTDNQRESITQLREAGWGYNKISNATGISINAIKSYCRRNNLAGYASRPNNARPDEHFGVCKNCGVLVEQTPKRKAKLFCSDECRMSWWSIHRSQIEHRVVKSITCPNCGKQFTVYGNTSRKYCSHECYIEDRFGKRREGTYGAEKNQKSDGEQRL